MTMHDKVAVFTQSNINDARVDSRSQFFCVAKLQSYSATKNRIVLEVRMALAQKPDAYGQIL